MPAVAFAPAPTTTTGLRYATTDLATRRYLRGLGLPSTACDVFALLAAHAASTGVAWPSVKTLASELGETERCVRDSLGRLRSAGVVHLVSTPHSRSQYRITLTPECRPVDTRPATDLTPERRLPEEEGRETMHEDDSKPPSQLLASPEVRKAQFACRLPELRTEADALLAVYCSTKRGVLNPAGLYRKMSQAGEAPPERWLALHTPTPTPSPTLPPEPPRVVHDLPPEDVETWLEIRETILAVQTCSPLRLACVIGLTREDGAWVLLVRPTKVSPDWSPILAACVTVLGVQPTVRVLT